MEISTFFDSIINCVEALISNESYFSELLNYIPIFFIFYMICNLIYLIIKGICSKKTFFDNDSNSDNNNNDVFYDSDVDFYYDRSRYIDFK